MDVGATLRRARNQKGLTLDQLSRATKITVSKLQALEDNDFDRLPAVVYTRGFLRSYAREVGLNPEEIVDQFLQQLEEAMALAEPQRPEALSEPAAPVHQRRGAAVPAITPLRIQIDLKGLPRPAMAAAAVVLLVAVMAALAWRGGNDTTRVANAEGAHQDADAAHASAPALAPVSDATHAAHVTDDALRIELKTTGPCWVSASADRAPVLARLLQAGESETIEAKDELVLRIGDPSTVTLTINGAPLRPLGEAGIPVTVQINRENYRALLAS
jgi:cytoskeletal protein RodZ